MTGLRLSLDEFLLSLKLAPRMVVEVVVENKEGGLLMLRREGDPFKGSWHLPGSFLMKGESISECVRRVLENECGQGGDSSVWQFVGLFENPDGDPRGHLIHCVVKVEDIKVETDSRKHFFATLPEKLIGYQKQFLSELGYK